MALSEARTRLQTEADAVRVRMIGLIGGIFTGLTTADIRMLEDAVIRYGVAQAKLDGLATTEEGLAVRDILPDLDFRDQNNNAVGRREWRQPWSGSLNGEQTERQMYQTNSNSANDRKVIIIYGVRLVSTGPARTSTALNSSAIIYKRASVKTIDIWDLEALDTNIEGLGFARTPILYKKADNARIDLYPKNGASGAADQIMLIGKVIESLSNNVTG